MEAYLNIFFWIHIFFGTIALLSGVAALVFKKGGKGHNASGKVYYWSMVGIGVTAFGIAIPKGNMFLLMVGGFSTYMTLTGYRFLQFRRNPNLKFGVLDYLFISVGFLTVIIPGYYVAQADLAQNASILFVFLVFSIFLLTMLIGDLIHSKKMVAYPKGWFLNRHISRMVGAFIATITAFLVQNWQSDPIFLAWLTPTVVLVPFIFYFTKKFEVTSRQLKPLMPAKNS